MYSLNVGIDELPWLPSNTLHNQCTLHNTRLIYTDVAAGVIDLVRGSHIIVLCMYMCCMRTPCLCHISTVCVHVLISNSARYARLLCVHAM